MDLSTPTPSSGSQTPRPSTTFAKLELLDPSVPHTFIQPAKRINDGPDVAHFLTSKAYRDIGIFVLQLNRALCPRQNESPTSVTITTTTAASDGGESTPATETPLAPPPSRRTAGSVAAGRARTFTLDAPRQDPPSVLKLQDLLDKVEAVVEEAPPDPGPRRFGNLMFRKWHSLLEEKVDGLLGEALAPGVLEFGRGGGDDESEGDAARPITELRAYFLGSFGSSQRLDYGTGHELSFLAFLGCLWKLGAFESEGQQDGEMERSIVLGVIERYLKVVRRLILTYTLEPAGSHGVWGLDDHCFISYIFGSAQLTRPISEGETMPTEGSVRGAPKPDAVVKAAEVDRHRGSNMYFSAIGFINDVKKGPFWEHSPILFDISGIKDGWGKINKGMIKMFNAEVLSKFPVVQHFPFGSLFSWDTDPDAAQPIQSVHMANQPSAAAASGGTTRPVPPPAGRAGTAAPWAQATGMPGAGGPGIPYSRAPWAAGGSSAPATSARGPPNTGPPPPTSFPKGQPGTTSAQHTVTKAPWAK